MEPFFREIGREIMEQLAAGAINLEAPDLHGVRLAKIPMSGGAMRPYNQQGTHIQVLELLELVVWFLLLLRLLFDGTDGLSSR